MALQFRCLVPECEFATVGDPDTERAKRIVVDHINGTHPESNVVIPCIHELTHIGTEKRPTRDAKGEAITVEIEIYECVRCFNRETRDPEPVPEPLAEQIQEPVPEPAEPDERMAKLRAAAKARAKENPDGG